MGIDKFINEYLDGSITPDDDEKFRGLLKQDPIAKEEFDLMVSIHSLLKEDAESIQIPKNLQQKVEDRILVQYLGMSSLSCARKPRRLTYSLVALLLSFILSINSISDRELLGNYFLFWSEIAKQKDLLISQVPNFGNQTISATKVNHLIINKLIGSHNTTEPQLQATFGASINSKENESSNFQTKDNHQVLVTNSMGNSSNIFSLGGKNVFTCLSQDFSLNKMKPLSLNNQSLVENKFISFRNGLKNAENSNNCRFEKIFSDYPTKGILLSGFSVVPILKFGYSDLKIKSYSAFSQSLGYKISDGIRLGLEFGYFDFLYEHSTTILVPATVVEPKSRKIYAYNQKKNQDNFILTNGGESPYPNFVQIVVPVERKYQIYWGSLFLDYVYQVSKYLSFAGRLNVGATSEGALGKVLLLTEFQPISGIAINIGLENKSYWSGLAGYSSIKNEIGFVYGISLKLDLE